MSTELSSALSKTDILPSAKGVGARLRAQRAARGWDIQEASKYSGVKAPFLSAIEKGETEALPSIGYVLGYVRSYARVLGLDEASCVADYKRELEAGSAKRPRGIPHFVPTRRWRIPKGSVPALGVVAAVVMLGSWYGVQLDTQAANSPVAPVVLEAQDIPISAATPDTIITVQANAPSWVSLQDARRRLVVNRVFVTGERWQVERGSAYTLSVRDGGAIELFIGERSLGALGSQGEPVRDFALQTVQ